MVNSIQARSKHNHFSFQKIFHYIYYVISNECNTKYFFTYLCLYFRKRNTEDPNLDALILPPPSTPRSELQRNTHRRTSTRRSLRHTILLTFARRMRWTLKKPSESETTTSNLTEAARHARRWWYHIPFEVFYERASNFKKRSDSSAHPAD